MMKHGKRLAISMAILSMGMSAPVFAEDGAVGVVNTLKGGIVSVWNALVPGTLNVVNDVVHSLHTAVHQVAQAMKVELKSNGG